MISKYPLNKKVQDRVIEIFLNTISDLKNYNDIDSFLNEFLSPTEKIMLAKRLSIAVFLSKNYDVRSISQVLKVSKNTIVKVNLMIKHKKGFLFNLVEKINKDEKISEFWKELEYNLSKASIPLTIGNWSKRRGNIEKDHYSKIKPF
jgi:uncharacterized protein YerC